MNVNILQYGKVVSTYQSNKPIRLIVGKVNPYHSSYDKDSDTLSLHLTKEKFSIAPLLSISSSGQ